MNLFDRIPDDVNEAIARILLAVLAVLIIWLLRGIVTWLISKPLKRLTSRTSAEWDDALADMIHQPVSYVALALGLLVVVQILSFDRSIVDFVTRLSRSLIILAAFVALYKVINLLISPGRRLFRTTGITIEDQLLPFARTAIKLVVVALAIVIIVQEWGYDVSGLVAGLGLGGLAFSLAAKDTVENLFGFSTIVGDRPFVVGEFIATPDVSGTVEKVGLRSTRIRQLDQALVAVPNGKMANSVITNWSRLRKRWIQFTFGVTYSASPDQIEALLGRIREMLVQRDHVDSATVQVVFAELGESSLDVLVRCYVDLPDWYEWMKEKEAINLAVMRIVAEMSLSMAFPSRSLYIETLPPALAQQTGSGQDDDSRG